MILNAKNECYVIFTQTHTWWKHNWDMCCCGGQQITRQIRAIGEQCQLRLHPRSGRQKVLAKASNKRPHFPQWPLLFGLLYFFSGFSLVTRLHSLANGTFTSSPAWISKGLQSSPTKVVFMHNLGCLNLDTSTKWIFCRNQLERLAWLRPTVQLLWLHFTWLRLVVTDVVVAVLDIESSCGSCCLCSCCWCLSSLKAIWPSYPPVIMTEGGGGGWNIARTTSSSGEMKSEKKEEEKGH